MYVISTYLNICIYLYIVIIARHSVQCVAVCCSVLRCAAVCCGVLQSIGLYDTQCVPKCVGSWLLTIRCRASRGIMCSVLQCVAVCCSVLQCVAVCCSVLQCAAVCCSVLQCVAVCCSVLQCVAVCCSVDNSLQSVARHFPLNIDVLRLYKPSRTRAFWSHVYYMYQNTQMYFYM